MPDDNNQNDNQNSSQDNAGADTPAEPAVSSFNMNDPVANATAPTDEPGGAPATDDSAAKDTSEDTATDFVPTASDSIPEDDSSAAVPAADDDLVEIKQQALQQLSPLVDHLDQTPEEKFHTTMMMIQASDDQNLIKTAYESAQQITDEKAKAQALLDIVNEINYFTQGGEKSWENSALNVQLSMSNAAYSTVVPTATKAGQWILNSQCANNWLQITDYW